MPAQAHTRIRLNGVIGPVESPFEIFSYGFCIGGADFLTPAQEAQITGACVAYHGSAGASISNAAHLTEVAISNVGADGKQVGNTTRTVVAQAGGNASWNNAPQVAYAVSLGTGQRGRSQRGRWFVPCPVATQDPTTGQMSTALVTGMAAAAVTFINSVNQFFPAGPAERGVVVAGKAGNLVVTTVRVGRVLDTIRSRRNAIPESYVTGPAVVSAG